MGLNSEKSNKMVRIITFHTPDNYGAVLQTFGLQTYLKEICSDVKVINYDTPELRSKYSIIGKPKTVKGLIISGLKVLNYRKRKRLKLAFERFRENKLDLTQRYHSIGELKANPPQCDLCITGSDQVFNPNRISADRQAYYLSFMPIEIPKASYAASFGVKDVPIDKVDEIASYLSGFSYLSVREESGAKIIESLTRKKPLVVLDPVFLLSREKWLSNQIRRPGLPDNYVLLYSVMGTEYSDKVASEVAQQLKLPLIVITTGVLFRAKADLIIRDATPQEFINIFNGAEYIVTDSFHGTAFSLIFNKQFILANNVEIKRDRPVSLLERLGLEDRADIQSLIEKIRIKIDYNKVNELLKHQITVCKKYLIETLDDK